MHRRVTKYMEIVSKKEDISLTSVMESGSRGRSPAPQRGDPSAVSADLHTGDFLKGGARDGEDEGGDGQGQPIGGVEGAGAGAGGEYRRMRGCPCAAAAGQAIP
uniref:Uncharacterized protein n=1 Tax=Siphoviridae sp. ct7es18 TaxID=2826166 RepID=A0A8S5MHA3_9CAUD|nr:MAG TPA: hypothetical protein [Siphoviridae sp. ct7es18]